ncbi:hypothetical protein J6590_041039 [Homalodisca vitripennis]|nr:hypothetical protein J6590_041039 [Homalodisca vitripennis]
MEKHSQPEYQRYAGHIESAAFDLRFLRLSFLTSTLTCVPLSSGDRWLVSCLGVLYLSKGLFYRVVPADQTFLSDQYAGVFRFRLWWCGEWVEVLVDDRLPTVAGKLAFLQSQHSDQFWPGLLEKAYANRELYGVQAKDILRLRSNGQKVETTRSSRFLTERDCSNHYMYIAIGTTRQTEFEAFSPKKTFQACIFIYCLEQGINTNANTAPETP